MKGVLTEFPVKKAAFGTCRERSTAGDNPVVFRESPASDDNPEHVRGGDARDERFHDRTTRAGPREPNPSRLHRYSPRCHAVAQHSP